MVTRLQHRSVDRGEMVALVMVHDRLVLVDVDSVARILRDSQPRHQNEDAKH